MKKFDKFYINGEWVNPKSTKTIEVVNPATETPCARVPSGKAGRTPTR